MNATNDFPRITLRIPGDWKHPGKLLERLPAGHRLTPEGLVLPDGAEVEFIPMPPDEQFVQIFASSCRRKPTEEERAIVERYTVNVGLSGPGGSRQAARTMMQAGAAIVRAGGAGVLIDNSGLAHGGRDWIDMTDDGGPDALSFAFASVIEGRHEAYTVGLQTLGLPNLAMRRLDVDAHGGDALIEILRYLCRCERVVDVGHVFETEEGLRFQAVSRSSDEFDPQSAMHNPLGQLRLVSLKSIAEDN